MTDIAGHSLINPRSITPLKLVLTMCAVWAAFVLMAPLELYMSPDTYPYVMLGGCLLGMLAGFIVFEPSRIPDVVIDRGARHDYLRQIYQLAFILGMLGIMLRLADWALFRGLSIDAGIFENREKVETAGASAFSMASTLLVPFTLVPYMIYAVARRNGERVGSAWTSIGLALLWPMLTVVIGSRSTMFMSIGMLMISRLIIFPRTSKKIIFFCATILLAMIYLGGLLFIQRISEYGFNIESSIRFSAFTQLAPVSQSYFSSVSGLPDWQRDTVFIFTTFVQYFVHGTPEFFHLVEHYRNGDQFGGYSFNVFVRLAYSLWGVPFDGEAVTFSTPRVGVYTTLFGPFYVDFGPFAPFVSFLFGAAISWTRRRVLMGDIGALPLYVCFLMQAAAAIIVNTIMNAYGIFYNLAFLLFWIGVATMSHQPGTVRPVSATDTSAQQTDQTA